MKKKHQIIILPSEKSIPIATFKKTGNFTKHNFNVGIFESDVFQPQHLYILSDKYEEWGCKFDYPAYFHVDATKTRWIITKNTHKPNPKFCRKIIATTDSELIKQSVAPIHKDIIKAYVKKPFDKVMVEYEEFFLHEDFEGYKPKLNQDGTISVSLVEEKMYSREEVEELCRNAHLLGMKETLPGYPKPETIDEWIKENL